MIARISLAFSLAVLSSPLASGQGYNPLHIPDTLSGTSFNLMLQHGTRQFLPGQATATAGINGSFWGPTLIFRKGQTVNLNVMNHYMDTTTVHWHGLHLPAVMDGGPHQTVAPMATWSPYFEVKNNAATYWYHPHLHMMTMEHLTSGLGGLIIVRDPAEEALNLPRTYGVDDIPLVLTDRRFDASNQFELVHYGDTMLVNGTLNPLKEVPAQMVRLRLLNAAPERSYNLGFSDNRPFYVITSDGGLLDAPVPVTRYLLSVGERIEVLVNFAGQQGQAVDLRAYNQGLPQGVPGFEPVNAVGGFGNALGNRNFNILRLQVGAPTAQPVTAMPAALAQNTFPQQASATVTRNIVMTMTGGMPGHPPAFSFNGQLFDMNTIDYQVNLGDTEIWELMNLTGMAHPFHIHDVQFHILSRNGQPAPAHEQGWKDVVLVNVNETVRFIARFTDYADDQHPYMYHCHMATHEDMGMMGQFVVQDPLSAPSAVEQLQALHAYPNPASGQIMFRVPAGFENGSITLYNALGVAVAVLPAAGAVTGADISALARGLYLATVRNAAGEVHSVRFLKE